MIKKNVAGKHRYNADKIFNVKATIQDFFSLKLTKFYRDVKKLFNNMLHERDEHEWW